MSNQRKAHPNLVSYSEWYKTFHRAMEHDAWLGKRIWKTGLHLKQKRWK